MFVVEYFQFKRHGKTAVGSSCIFVGRSLHGEETKRWGKIAFFFDECRGPMQCFLRMKNFGLRPMLPHEKFSRFLVSFVGSLFCPTDPLSLLPAHGRQVYCDTYGLDREFGGFSRVAGV